MFENLRNEIKNLNSNVNNVVNSKRAKELRKKLLTIGGTLIAVGIIGTLVCFALFATGGMKMVLNHSAGFSFTIIIPFTLIIPFSLLASVGGILFSLGLKIVITGFTTDLINETVGNNCPNCGNEIEKDEIYCSKCGARLRIKCKKCGKVNSPKDRFCRECGEEL